MRLWLGVEPVVNEPEHSSSAIMLGKGVGLLCFGSSTAVVLDTTCIWRHVRVLCKSRPGILLGTNKRTTPNLRVLRALFTIVAYSHRAYEAENHRQLCIAAPPELFDTEATARRIFRYFQVCPCIMTLSPIFLRRHSHRIVIYTSTLIVTSFRWVEVQNNAFRIRPLAWP